MCATEREGVAVRVFLRRAGEEERDDEEDAESKDGNIVRVEKKGGTEELGGFVQGTWKAHKSTFASSIMGETYSTRTIWVFPLCVMTSHLESRDHGKPAVDG